MSRTQQVSPLMEGSPDSLHPPLHPELRTPTALHVQALPQALPLVTTLGDRLVSLLSVNQDILRADPTGTQHGRHHPCDRQIQFTAQQSSPVGSPNPNMERP